MSSLGGQAKAYLTGQEVSNKAYNRLIPYIIPQVIISNGF